MRHTLSLLAAALALTAATDPPPATAPPAGIVPADAQPRTGRCVIEAAAAPRWAGLCRIKPEGDSGFTVTPTRGSFQNDVVAISFVFVSPGSGEVRGLTSGGVNSRWGGATRSSR